MRLAPRSLASSYVLTRHALTASAVADIAPAVRSELADALDSPIETFECTQIGKCNTDSPNHSLPEYTDA